jgi:hypothetical protein
MVQRSSLVSLWLPLLVCMAPYRSLVVLGFSTISVESYVRSHVCGFGLPSRPRRTASQMLETSYGPKISALCSSALPQDADSSSNSQQGRDDRGDLEEQNSRVSSFSSRRHVLSFLVAAAVGPVSLSVFPEPSLATYTSYSRREQDWEERNKNGEVEYKSPRQLRQQLRDIVPQNSEKSKIFCPNGVTSAVSPLMENKCGDRMALPSVYGRSDDPMGNSIPGFSADWKAGSGTGSIVDGSGGFPSYSGASGRRN